MRNQLGERRRFCERGSLNQPHQIGSHAIGREKRRFVGNAEVKLSNGHDEFFENGGRSAPDERKHFAKAGANVGDLERGGDGEELESCDDIAFGLAGEELRDHRHAVLEFEDSTQTNRKKGGEMKRVGIIIVELLNLRVVRRRLRRFLCDRRVHDRFDLFKLRFIRGLLQVGFVWIVLHQHNQKL